MGTVKSFGEFAIFKFFNFLKVLGETIMPFNEMTVFGNARGYQITMQCHMNMNY